MNTSAKQISSSIYEMLFIVFYSCIGFIPNLEAIDKIAPQWLFMGVLNFIVGLYIIKNISVYTSQFKGYWNSWLIRLYIFFIIWGSLSFFYAINPTEVLVNFSRQFHVFFMLTNMVLLFSVIPNKARFVSTLLVIILAIEVVSVLQQAYEMLSASGQIKGELLKGVTANRNITAFSIAIKTPFVLYLMGRKTQTKSILFLGVLLTMALVCLSMIQSRASYIAAALVTLMFVGMTFYFYKGHSVSTLIRKLGLLIVPLALTIVINQTFLANRGADAVSRAATISLSTNDGSVNQRLRYYEDVLTHFSSNPIFGVGLGNWKFKSIDYDKKDMIGYSVPYHAHSDFIQLGAELGIFGFLSYLGIFLLIGILIYKLLYRTSLSKDHKVFIYLVTSSLGVYFIDANLNFPIARPQVLVVWTLLIAIILDIYIKQTEETVSSITVKFDKSFMALMLTVAIPTIFISFKVFGSQKNQMFLLQDFNSDQYQISLAQIEAMDMSIPNVTVTTIPLTDIKARYYLNAKKYDTALSLLEDRQNSNPYLFYGENLKSRAYEAKGKIDSAYHYAKKAYLGLPNNKVHVANFVRLATLKKDLGAVAIAAENLLKTHSKDNWRFILTAYVEITGYGNEKLMAISDKAVRLFPGDSQLLLIRKMAAISTKRIKEAELIASEATVYFNNSNYNKATELYLQASKVDSLEYSYLENAATSFYQAKEYGNALLYSSKVIDRFQPGTGKAEYLHGISKIAIGDRTGGCEFLTKSLSYGYSQAEETYQSYCQ